MTKKKASSKAVAKVEPAAAPAAQPKSGLATVKAMFERQTDQIGAALAGQMNTGRFIRTALTAYSRGDARFQSSAPISLLGACMKAAEMGLSVDPMLGEYWLIPRRNRKRNCMWIDGQLGYKGLIKLAKRNPTFRNVKAELVHKGDFFEYELGSEPFVRHRLATEQKERPEVIMSYATVYYKDGSSFSHVSPMYEILEARQRSEAFRNGHGPWVDHFNSMAKIVPLRAIMKLEAIDSMVLEQLGREDLSVTQEDVVEVQMDDAIVEEAPPAQIAEPGSVDELKAKFGGGKQTEIPDESA